MHLNLFDRESRILRTEDVVDLSTEARERLRAEGYLLPISGGSPEGDDDSSDDADADAGEADDAGDDDDDASGDGGDDDAAGDDDDGEENPAVEAARRAQREAEQVAERERRARKKAERQVQKRKRDDQASQGQYEQLYKDSQSENERLRGTIRDGDRDRAVLAKATELQFRSPELALRSVAQDLPEDAVDEDGDVDERVIERTLKALASKEPYLVKTARPQGDVQGDGGRGGGSSNGGSSNGRGSRRTAGQELDPDKFDPRGRLERAYANSGTTPD